jgi:hypothetical protein
MEKNSELKKIPNSVRQLIVDAQIKRFRNDYEKYFNQKKTTKMVSFFFDKIYSLEDKEKRDNLTINTVMKVRKHLKESTCEKLDSLLNLNDITDYLDLVMAKRLIMKGWENKKQISDKEYQLLYKECNNRDKRIDQYNLLIWNFETFYKLSRKSILKFLIKPLKIAAKAFGVIYLYKIFEEAYKVSRPISKEIFYPFLEEVKKHEITYIDNHLPQDPLN